VFFHQHTDRLSPAPTLVTVHSPIRTSEPNSLVGRLLCSARWVAAVSEAMLDDVRQLLPDLASRSNVIYNGLEAPEIEPAPLPFEEPRLLCIGRVVVDKGFDLAIDAFASIIKRFPRARLVIAGDGVARPELEAQVARLGLEGAVDFAGWVTPEKITELINAATMVLMPSRWREPFGLVALQAAQIARPIVATRVGGIPEIVLHEETGLLVEKDDSAALAKQIAFLLEHPNAATKMGQNARKKAQENFSMERFANDYDVLYRKLIEGPDG
jgi:glycogen(starch) synthase